MATMRQPGYALGHNDEFSGYPRDAMPVPEFNEEYMYATTKPGESYEYGGATHDMPPPVIQPGNPDPFNEVTVFESRPYASVPVQRFPLTEQRPWMDARGMTSQRPQPQEPIPPIGGGISPQPAFTGGASGPAAVRAYTMGASTMRPTLLGTPERAAFAPAPTATENPYASMQVPVPVQTEYVRPQFDEKNARNAGMIGGIGSFLGLIAAAATRGGRMPSPVFTGASQALNQASSNVFKGISETHRANMEKYDRAVEIERARFMEAQSKAEQLRREIAVGTRTWDRDTARELQKYEMDKYDAGTKYQERVEDANRANASAQNQAAQFNASQRQDASRFNASQRQQVARDVFGAEQEAIGRKEDAAIKQADRDAKLAFEKEMNDLRVRGLTDQNAEKLKQLKLMGGERFEQLDVTGDEKLSQLGATGAVKQTALEKTIATKQAGLEASTATKQAGLEASTATRQAGLVKSAEIAAKKLENTLEYNKKRNEIELAYETADRAARLENRALTNAENAAFRGKMHALDMEKKNFDLASAREKSALQTEMIKARIEGIRATKAIPAATKNAVNGLYNARTKIMEGAENVRTDYLRSQRLYGIANIPETERDEADARAQTYIDNSRLADIDAQIDAISGNVERFKVQQDTGAADIGTRAAEVYKRAKQSMDNGDAKQRTVTFVKNQREWMDMTDEQKDELLKEIDAAD